jgi:roadblock/LC7 domain-containing protein
MVLSLGITGGLLTAAGLSGAPTPPAAKPGKEGPVSFSKQVHPLLRQACQGCHQPASAGGKLILTTHAALLKGGEHGPGFISGKPDVSNLVKYVSGPMPKMPMGGTPLTPAQVALLRRWIQEGARDDTTTEKVAIDADHPPVYQAPPVISALAYSPDGTTLAVSGYHEVLLHHVDGSGLLARLVGKSPRIESLAYSPDGKTLAAAGGAPAQFGEIEFWDAETRKPINAVNATFDALFAASFSPDGKQLAFSAADNSVRVVSVPDGKGLLNFGNHSDWVFGTAFSTDGKHLISAGRDQAIKLTIIEGGSFVDDVNKHYDALKALARHPTADQVICGGQDAIPRLYQVFRTTARTMNNEDHNLLREFERQPGPISAVAFSPDGKLVAVGGAADEARVYDAKDGRRIAALRGNAGGVFALAFSPSGDRVAAGGFDGRVRLYALPTGQLAKAFVPVPLENRGVKAAARKDSSGGIIWHRRAIEIAATKAQSLPSEASLPP